MTYHEFENATKGYAFAADGDTYNAWLAGVELIIGMHAPAGMSFTILGQSWDDLSDEQHQSLMAMFVLLHTLET